VRAVEGTPVVRGAVVYGYIGLELTSASLIGRRTDLGLSPPGHPVGQQSLDALLLKRLRAWR
jgi:hypothetical protein